jgi:hypothetical protein
MSRKSKGWIFPVLAIAAATSGAMSDDHIWIMGAAILAGGTLVAYLIVELAKPAWRQWRLRHPCKVYFNIMTPKEGEVPYVLRDSRGHFLKELVLPPNTETEIELIYVPKVPFFESELNFGCESDVEGKPYAIERFIRYPMPGKGKAHWIPGTDETDTLDRHKFYHVIRNKPRNTGTHFIVGFKLKTEVVGVFPTKLYFLTNEREGSADLTIRVEERPTTSMKCAVKSHGECYVYPTVRLPPL